MNLSARIVSLVFGAFLAAACLADDEQDVIDESAHDESASLEALLAESAYADEWQIDPSVDPTTESIEWEHAMDALEFEDSNGFARVARLRTLSFLTLAQSGKARLFLGVNEEGFVGLHYRAVSAKPDSDYRELARMPYVDDLAEIEQD